MTMAQSTPSGVEATIASSSSSTTELQPRDDNDNAIDPRCRIVVVSSSIESAKGFVERVISLSDNKNDKTTRNSTSNQATETESQPAGEGETPKDRYHHRETRETEHKGKDVVVIPHTLRNRYYEADVWFWVVGVEKLKSELSLTGGVRQDEEEKDDDDDAGFGKFDAGDGAFKSDDDDEEEEKVQDGETDIGEGTKMTKAPAIVYVWDDMERCRKEIGELVRGMKRCGWHGDDGAEVCLAVRVGGGGEEGHGDVDVDVDGMFMGHGFEYVDGRDGSGSGGDEEEDEDVPRLPRVLDALSTVMWASMRSKSNGGRTDTRSGKQVTRKGIEEEDEEREGLMNELLDVVVSRGAEEEDDDVEFGEMMSSPVDIDMLSPFGFGQEGGAGVRRKVSMGFEDDFVHFGGYVALEEEEKEMDGDADDLDDALPTKEEIEQTVSRIFGGSGGGGEMDLSSVLLSLQELKGEIAGMADGEEKRRMAARVALGLAYAL